MDCLLIMAHGMVCWLGDGCLLGKLACNASYTDDGFVCSCDVVSRFFLQDKLGSIPQIRTRLICNRSFTLASIMSWLQ